MSPQNRCPAYRGKLSERISAALHRVRAHPKTYPPELPLMGRVIGTFLWHPHVRGSAERGTITKDYNVEAPGTLGDDGPSLG